MSKWLISHSTSTRPWQIIEFVGPNGGESAGIVDLIAARRSYAPDARGDLFELLFIQVKGGASPRPSVAALERLERAAAHHGASAIVLCEWQKGSKLTASTLRRDWRRRPRAEAWELVDAAFFSRPLAARAA